MIAALRRFLAWWNAPPSAPHLDLAREAVAAEPPTTLVVAVSAGYLPHGGMDELVLRLRHDGGLVTRVRTRKDVVERVVRELTSEEAQAIAADLERRDLWNLRDVAEPIMDGRVCLIAVAKGERLHSTRFHGSHRSEAAHLTVLRILQGFAPVESDAPRRRPSSRS